MQGSGGTHKMDQNVKRRGRGRPRGNTIEPSTSTVQALERAVYLLRALAEDGEANLSELALRVGMPASSVHRLLSTLETHAMVDFNAATQDWSIGVETFRIGNAFIQRGNLVERARDVMHHLVEETGETANLAQEHDGEIVVLSQADTTNPIRAFFRAGMRVPMHSSGIGKALLAQKDRRAIELILQRRKLETFTDKTLTTAERLYADLAATRARGWSFDDEERYAGMRCIAAPIFNHHGEAIAGISVSGPTARFTPVAIPKMAACVTRAASRLTEATGGQAPVLRNTR